jgi:hypothetical protein
VFNANGFPTYNLNKDTKYVDQKSRNIMAMIINISETVDLLKDPGTLMNLRFMDNKRLSDIEAWLQNIQGALMTIKSTVG